MIRFRCRKISIKFVAGAWLLSQSLLLAPMSVLADNTVRIGGQQVFALSTTDASRAAIVQENLDNALVAAKDRSASAVGITYVNGLPVVTLDGYSVVSVTAEDAENARTTPAILAKSWADKIRSSLADENTISNYIAQLTNAPSNNPGSQAPNNNKLPAAINSGYANPISNTGYEAATPPPANYYGGPPANYNAPPPNYSGYRQGRLAYAPAGLVIPFVLKTPISTSVAKAGDLVEGSVSETLPLGDSSIPAGSALIGTITQAESGRRLSRSGELGIKFTQLRTADGAQVPINGHLKGSIGKYAEKNVDGNEVVRGEGLTAKLGQTALRGGAGAGLGAALGTAVGAIAGAGTFDGAGHGAGRGAWSGAAIGGGLGVADMALRKGRDVTLPSGTRLEIQLDAPATIAGS